MERYSSVAGAMQGATAELEQASNSLQGKTLPSWLATDDVKLMPLHTLISEQMRDEKLADGKASQVFAHEEHPAAQPTPRQLAFHTVHHLAAAKKGAHMAAPVHVHHTVEALAEGVGESKAAQTGEAAVASMNSKVAKDAEAVKADQKEINAVSAKEAAAEAAFMKAEKGKLEVMRSAAEKEEKSLNVKEDMAQADEKRSEKSAIKAQMAQVEAEEAGKLAALEAKVKAEESEKLKKLKLELHGGASQGGKKQAHAEGAVHKATTAAHGDEDVIKASVKKAAHARLARKAGCANGACDLNGKLDQAVKEVVSGKGEVREEAIKKMQSLQQNIANDFKHVTSFAVKQEHALGSAN